MISLIAHRGNDNKKWLENSITGLVNSLKEEYIAGIELDVRMTKDKKIVVIHGMILNDSIKEAKFISQMTLKEVKEYDVDPSSNKLEIATLEEVLCKIDSEKKILIEIKEESIFYKTMIKQVHRILRRYSHLNYYICSFHYRLLKTWKTWYPKDKVGVLIGYLLNTDQFDTDLDFLCVNKRYLNRCNFKKETFIWTVNTQKELDNILKKTNHVSIITDCASSFHLD